MTITINIKNEKVAEFYQLVEEHDLKEMPDHRSPLEDHLDEALRREQDPVLSKARPWSEARERYVGKGL